MSFHADIILLVDIIYEYSCSTGGGGGGGLYPNQLQPVVSACGTLDMRGMSAVHHGVGSFMPPPLPPIFYSSPMVGNISNFKCKFSHMIIVSM